MKVEIWSDIMCPFCYIGKRNFEAALTQFKNAHQLQIEWKSFQLDPSIPVGKIEQNVYEYLATSKGWTMEQCLNIHEQVTQSAKQVGLVYNFDQAKVCNSFNAHRIIQFAKTKGWGDLAEEMFFRSYFTDGKDLNDSHDLATVASAIGLTSDEISNALTDEKYANAVTNDIQEAAQLGVRGVPFFVMDRKYAVSGAQPSDVFLQTLEKSFEEWQLNQSKNSLHISEGPSCDIDGNCED